MRRYQKKDFPVSKVRRFLEPGPVVLLSSAWQGRFNIMTLGWHTVMEFTPSLIGCLISEQNCSFEVVKRTRECVINLPTRELAKQVVGIGHCSGTRVDKFERFELTPAPAKKVKAPLIEECYANFECRLYDAKLVKRYNLFIFEVVKAHVAVSPKYPRTLHYRGEGIFMTSGPSAKLSARG